MVAEVPAITRTVFTAVVRPRSHDVMHEGILTRRQGQPVGMRQAVVVTSFMRSSTSDAARPALQSGVGAGKCAARTSKHALIRSSPDVGKVNGRTIAAVYGLRQPKSAIGGAVIGCYSHSVAPRERSRRCRRGLHDFNIELAVVIGNHVVYRVPEIGRCAGVVRKISDGERMRG